MPREPGRSEKANLSQPANTALVPTPPGHGMGDIGRRGFAGDAEGKAGALRDTGGYTANDYDR